MIPNRAGIPPRIDSLVPSNTHIGPAGELETHAAAEQRLLAEFHFADRGLFHSHEELMTEAYRRREDRIAWR
ncbi:MAG: hypothetical protein ACK5Q5_06730 [Planctomycetaceae bacterium]